jgi:hypothetical protein
VIRNRHKTGHMMHRGEACCRPQADGKCLPS